MLRDVVVAMNLNELRLKGRDDFIEVGLGVPVSHNASIFFIPICGAENYLQLLII